MSRDAIEELDKKIERMILREEQQGITFFGQTKNDGESVASACSMEEISNLMIYGFRRVKVLSATESDDYALAVYDANGNITDEMIAANPVFLKKLAKLKAEMR